MLCSVVMSVYNSEATISESIESILNQTYKDYEFLIIDDGSNDETVNKIKSFSDPRIKFYKNEQNICLTKSLNKLIIEASGKYVVRQDADDVSLNVRLEKQIGILENSSFQITTSRAYNRQNKSYIPKLHLPYKYLLKFKNPFIHGTLCIEKKLLLEIGMYDEEFKYSQDYKLFADLIRSNNKIYVFKEPLYILNMEDNISTRNFEEQKYFSDLVKSELRNRKLY